MTKHRLDQATEDILQHYGIKGMKWDVRRSEEELAAARAKAEGVAAALEDAGDEIMGNDSIKDELGDVLDIIFGGEGDLAKEAYELADATKDKLEDISADVKKRGAKMMERMFGKSQATTKVKTITGKEKTVKKSDIVPLKNPFTGKQIVVKDKNGNQMALSRKKIEMPKMEAKNNFEGVDRKKLRNR